MKKFYPEGRPVIIFLRRWGGWIKTFISIFSSLLPAIIIQSKFTADFEANILWGKSGGDSLLPWRGASPLDAETKNQIVTLMGNREEEHGNEK